MTIKNMIAATVFAALFATSQAYAGDESSTTWNGQYAGFAAGASYGTADPNVHTRGSNYFIGTDASQLDPPASHTLKKTNASGSLYWGINRQAGNTVYGLEADLSLDSFDKQYGSGNMAALTLPGTTFAVTNRVKSDWSISLRPRLGYASDRSLFYISAGPSLRRFTYDFTYSDTTVFNTRISLSNRKWKLGWTAGAGYEFKLQDGWSLRGEYLYSFYRNIINTQSTLVTTFPTTDGFSHKLNFQEQKFRIGISKSF